MCYAGNCHPECDNCKPKYVWCPRCAARLPITQKRCHLCDEPINDGHRERAVENWKANHIGKDPGPLDYIFE